MDALTKAQRAKIFPAAKAALLDYYTSTKDIPKWSDIGTLVRVSLREAMISQLRVSDNGDVAEYLECHESEIDKFLHKKVKTLRERRYQSMLVKPLVNPLTHTVYNYWQKRRVLWKMKKHLIRPKKMMFEKIGSQRKSCVIQD